VQVVLKSSKNINLWKRKKEKLVQISKNSLLDLFLLPHKNARVSHKNHRIDLGACRQPGKVTVAMHTHRLPLLNDEK
jgi:hypothetical protein